MNINHEPVANRLMIDIKHQPERVLLRLVTCNRLVNLGISKQQHLYLKTKNLI